MTLRQFPRFSGAIFHFAVLRIKIGAYIFLAMILMFENKVSAITVMHKISYSSTHCTDSPSLIQSLSRTKS